jgi:tRNA(Ile)-lysidine synthase
MAADTLEARLRSSLGPYVKDGHRLLLGLSGGMDSVVLLTVLASLRRSLGFELQAMHVHHGLSPNAEQWADFCTALCRSLDVGLKVARVTIPRRSAAGTEATARAARYDALLGTSADFVVLAHHQDDQAETLLLQLTRGAGVKGLSAMAKVDFKRRLLRPMLDIGRDEIRAYAEQHGLQWVEDESNQDIHYDRNHIRHHTLPALETRFPGVRKVIARSASHIAEASELLNDLALQDAQRCMRHQQLLITKLQSLSEARARNLLRWWLASQDIVLPSTARLQEMLHQLLDARPAAQVKMAIGPQGTCLRRYQDMVYLEREQPAEPFSLIWQGEAVLHLPDGSSLRFQHGLSQGLAYQRLGIDRLRVAQRSGGERFKPDLARPSRTLKHLLQEANMPPWQRQRLPLVYHEDSLALVPGIGVAAHLQAAEHEPALNITWQQAPG